MDYNIVERKEYEIACESCMEYVVSAQSPEAVTMKADLLGFTSMYTQEDGVINYCPKCLAKLNEEE